jgi:hypothetical protein
MFSIYTILRTLSKLYSSEMYRFCALFALFAIPGSLFYIGTHYIYSLNLIVSKFKFTNLELLGSVICV